MVSNDIGVEKLSAVTFEYCGPMTGSMSDSMSDSSAAGLDVGNVSAWLDANVYGAVGPYRFKVVAGGHSNLTYSATGADGKRFVVRRPPLGPLLASAHDMGREHRIISALAATAVPVAPALGYCDDLAVTGAPFYVMGFVDALVLRTPEDAVAHLDVTARAATGRSIVDTLVAIHAVDPVHVGLGDLGRHEGYIARQLKRWYGQFTAQKTREVPAVDAVHDALVSRIPAQGPVAIAHGDYRLDNTMVDSAGNVAAVLDWEICTLGDPLADVGLLMVYWTGPDDEESAWSSSTATTAPGFWNRQQLLDHYAEASGRDLIDIDFYIAFAFWKLACILEGVYARYLAGALGDRNAEEFLPFKLRVEAAASQAQTYLERVR